MKNVRKKVLTLVLALSLALGMILPVQTAEAASAEMKKANVSWDLKNGKTLSFKTYYTGIGLTKQTAKMTGFKIKNSSKKGYKECTFTLNFKAHVFTEEEVHKCGSAHLDDSVIGGIISFKVVDYVTGKSLNASNSKNVTVSSPTGWVMVDQHYYEDDDGCWVRVSDSKITLTITYPKNYKNLCIGFTGCAKAKTTKNDEKFGNGKLSFNKTSYFSKKDKSVAHFMRIK